MKTITTITLDVEVLLEAKKQHINVSKVVNDTLKEYLKMDKDKEVKDIALEKSKLQAELLHIQQLEDAKKKEDEKTVIIDL